MSVNVYIVTYDICEAKRLRQVYQCMRNWGDHQQYSVFRCHLNRTDVQRLKMELEELIHNDHDQVLFFDLGPLDGRGPESIDSLGVPYTHPERHAHVF